MTAAPRLTRAAVAEAGHPLPAPPVRIVHLGVGAFHRSHQAWYTSRATDGADWGIAAFTGRDDAVARRLTPQDGLFTLIERGPDHDRFEVVGSIVEARPSSELGRFLELMSSPATAVVTLTVTEAGYHFRPDGTLDLDDPQVAHDIPLLRDRVAAGLRTPVARLLAGLEARRAAGAGPITVVSCDNIPDNGGLLQHAVELLGDVTGQADAASIASFVSTSVDRITPHTTAADIRDVESATGWHDEAAVVAEPFVDWILSGEFPAGRPAWESAGARFVDDIEPYERRKLLVLNGGHLLLAFHGLLRGHATVAQAVADPECRQALELFWDEASRTVGPAVDTAAYRAALVARFENPRIEHRLTQIAVDTVTKLRLRILPVLSAERAAGRAGDGAAAVMRLWSACLDAGWISVGDDADLDDFVSAATEADPRLSGELERVRTGPRRTDAPLESRA